MSPEQKARKKEYERLYRLTRKRKPLTDEQREARRAYDKQYRQARGKRTLTPEQRAKLNERSRRHAKKNRAKVTEIHKRWVEKNPDRARAIAIKNHHANPPRKLLVMARARAKKRGLEFNLDLTDTAVPDVCPVLGMALRKGPGGFHDNSATLDRIDNTKGYVKGNVAVVSWRANRIKCDATLEELKMLVAYLEKKAA